MNKTYDVAIIGCGATGQMAVLRAVLSHLNTVVFMGDKVTTRRSRATWVKHVDNIPGFFDKKSPVLSDTRDVLKFIEGREDLKPFLTVVKKAVSTATKNNDTFELKAEEETYSARNIVLCTGTMDKQPLIQGKMDPIFPYANSGDLMYCIRCDGHRTAGKTCAVLGHDSHAGEIAIILKERYDLPKMTILTNGEKYKWKDDQAILFEKYGIEVLEAEIEDLVGNPKEGLKGFMVAGKQIDAQKAFINLGAVVYNDLAKQLSVELADDEHIITHRYGETNIRGFFAAGDLVHGKKKQIYTAWDMAVDAVDKVDGRIRRLKREGKY